ncbi:hypothetical protein M405DRAFT_937685 [Rhizopogon salebrosus TDB-379]|nr:hypothetical protein M405DRAFT_937685 [Rhizopogon salebrosus TDB-379]
MPPGVTFDSYCHSALLRWTTPFAVAIRDCATPLNTMPKMSGIQVNDACGAGDDFGRLALDSGAAKYPYAAVWSPGLWAPAGKRRYSLMAIVATLARPTPDRSVLMPHDDERYLSKRWDMFSMDKIFLVGNSREETVT